MPRRTIRRTESGTATVRRHTGARRTGRTAAVVASRRSRRRAAAARTTGESPSRIARDARHSLTPIAPLANDRGNELDVDVNEIVDEVHKDLAGSK